MMSRSNIVEQAFVVCSSKSAWATGWEQFCRWTVKFHSNWNVADIEEQFSPPKRGAGAKKVFEELIQISKPWPRFKGKNQGYYSNISQETPADRWAGSFRKKNHAQRCKKIPGVHLWKEVDANSILWVANLFVIRGTKHIWDISLNTPPCQYTMISGSY